MSIRHDTTFPLAIFLGAALLGAPAAQEPMQQPQDRAATASTYVALESMIGGTVRLDPSAAEQQEAREEGERSELPTGEIKEILMNAEGGELECAIVSFGGLVGIGDRTVAVPFKELQWVDADDSFRLSATEKELSSLPAYDIDAAVERGLDSSLDVAKSSWDSMRRMQPGDQPRREAVDPTDPTGGETGETGERTEPYGEGEGKVAEATGKQSDQHVMIDGESYAFHPGRLVRASKLDDFDLYARTEEFGDVSKALVDMQQCRVALVVVDRGGVLGIGESNYLLPFASLDLFQKVEDRDEMVWHVDRSKVALEGAVKYKEPSDGLVDQDAARQALEQFGAESKTERQVERERDR
jgi:hypothetical protein